MVERNISDALRGELQLSGLTDEQIDRLHYSSVTAEGAKDLTGHAHAGWVVPCLAASGKPYTTSKDKPFYRLKPAVPPIKDGKETRYLSPAGEGCRPYFSVLWPDWARTLEHRDRDLAEGEKKADCGCAHGFPTIGLSGVDGWRDQRSGDSAVLPELLITGWLKGTVRIAWDSDIVHKTSVLASSYALAEAIAIAGGTPLITLLPPELNGEKNGVDDFILRHGAAAYGLLRDYARPAGEIIYSEEEPIGLKWTWAPEPKGDEATHSKALIAWTVLKDEVQLLPLGAYRWAGTHWHREEEAKAGDYLARTLHTWMDQIRWKKRTGAAFSSVLSELKSRLESPEAVIWDAPHLMAFSNGTLNTRTNTFTPGHRRSDRLTRCLPYPYNPSATCPNWLAFLDGSTGSDQEMTRVVQAAMRWTIEPKDGKEYPYEYMFEIIGGKGRGKGTALSGVVTLCGGPKNVATFNSSSFSNPNALLKMLNRPASIDSDASGFIKQSDTLNKVVSNEVVEVKALYKNVFETALNTVLWRATNDRPEQASGASEGSDRRLIPLPFDFVPKAKDPQLKAKIRAEAAGIFQWVWQMPMEEAALVLSHASDSKRIRNAQVDAALSRNPVLRFLYETYFSQGCSEVESSELFETFRGWLEKGREDGRAQGRELTIHRFGREMAKLVSSGEQRLPLEDAHGAYFLKFRTAGMNPGRAAYRVPEMGSWPIGTFLTGHTPENPDAPASANDGGKASGISPTPQDSSAQDPRSPLNPEPSDPSKCLKEESSKEVVGKSTIPLSLSGESDGGTSAQKVQDPLNPSAAGGLNAEPPGGLEPLASAPPSADLLSPAIPPVGTELEILNRGNWQPGYELKAVKTDSITASTPGGHQTTLLIRRFGKTWRAAA